MIVSWPAQITAAGRAPPVHARRRHRARRSTSCSASSRPRSSRATRSTRSRASASRRAFDDADAETGKQTQFYSMVGTRGDLAPGLEGRRRVAGRARHVGRLRQRSAGSCSTPRTTRASATTSPSEQPEKLQELIALWWAEAGQYGALPLENRDAVEILAHRPAAAARSRGTATSTTPDGAEVPESVAPNIRNRSYTIAVEVTIDTAGGGRRPVRPGRAVRRPRAVHQGRQAQVRLQLGRRVEQIVESTEPRPDRRTSSCRPRSSARATRCRPRAR